jgi:co-chaperonin GroES (HSP10)
MSKRIQPIGNKLIVLPSEKKEETLASGIIVAETANANLLEGKVLEAAKEFEHLVKQGDTVIFSSGSGVGQFYNGKPVIWLQIGEIWGTIEKATS